MTLRTIPRWLQKSYLRIITSIAFIPSILASGFLLLSLWTLYIDESSPEKLISYSVSVQNLIHPDSARSLLSAITGGMISLMVFSFSMVMIVLSQTASNYSPRVLPNLIGQRFHQVVMGTYLGTILYTIIVLSSIQSKLYVFDVPHLSIVLSTLFGLISLAMFVAFVHSISQHIQIGSIIRNLYSDTLKSLSSHIKNTETITEDDLPTAQTWVAVNCPVAGYLFGMNNSALKKFCQQTSTMVWMAHPWGVYVHRWQPLLRVSRQLSDEEKERLVNIFIFESDEILSQNYAVGFKQLTEIAVKALSPGINDPGTAIEAIDQLATLFTRQIEAQEIPVITDKQNRLLWIGRPISFEELFTWCWTAIKDYASQDTVVLYKMIEWLETMVHSDSAHLYTNILTLTLLDLLDHITENVKSTADQQNLSLRIQQFLKRSSNTALNERVKGKVNEQQSDTSI